MNNVLKSIFVPVAHVKKNPNKTKKKYPQLNGKSKSVENESCSVLLCSISSSKDDQEHKLVLSSST